MLLGNSYGSADCEHGAELLRGEWSADSRFFVFSTQFSGGHQPWHYPTYTYDRCSNRVVELQPAEGPVVSPDFNLFPNDALGTETWERPGRDRRRPVLVDLPKLSPCPAAR